MSRVCLFLLTVLIACASGYEDATRKDSRIVDDIPVLSGELGKPLLVTCLESEDPTLFVFWYRGPGERELLRNGEVYGLRQNALLIRSLTIDTLGAYTCQAFSGIDMKPPRAFVVRASPGTQPTASVETSTITTTTTEAPRLRFTDPVRKPAGVGGDENATVTGELGSPLDVRCLAYGYPPPSVFWYHGFNEESMVMILHSDKEYEMKENLLTIKRLSMDSLGQYKCGAYNGLGQPASWKVVVRAYKTEWLFSENDLLVPRVTMVSRTAQPPTEDTANATTTSEPIEMARLLVTDPVRIPAGISGEEVDSVIGELFIPLQVCCPAYGYPPLSVKWYRSYEGNTLLYNDTVYEPRENVLLIRKLESEYLGLYTCEAYNGVDQPVSRKVVVRAYRLEGHFDDNEFLVSRDTQPSILWTQCPTVETTTTTTNLRTTEPPRPVTELVAPAGCIDNPIFANCNLVVRSNFCTHRYYSKFCCKTCLEAGQPIPSEAELKADQPLRKN